MANILLSKLDARERDIISMHFGLKSKDGQGITLDNISLRYACCRSGWCGSLEWETAAALRQGVPKVGCTPYVPQCKGRPICPQLVCQQACAERVVYSS